MKKIAVIYFCVVLLLLAVYACYAQDIEFVPRVPSVSIRENGSVFDPCTYGAEADDVRDDAKAIQAAIDVCAVQGGGIVALKNGTFLSSPLVLKSGVYLKIEGTAVLQAISYMQYPGKNLTKPAPFIEADNASDFGIFGTGIIDGNGADWWRTQGWQGEFMPKRKIPNAIKRPNLVTFTNCSKIIIKDITLQNAPQFSIVPKNCTDIVISNVRIYNPANSPNTDGIDPTGSNIFIDGCEIDTGDDNIAIKAHNGATHNIYITNNTFRHGHGLSIGSDFEFGVQDVFAQNCTFVDTDIGIRIKSARDRGGLIKNIHYRNFKMQNVGKAIEITGYYPKIPGAGQDTKAAVTATTPCYEDIYITGLTAEAYKEAGSIIGLPESYIKNVSLHKVEIRAIKGLRVRNAEVKSVMTTIQAEFGGGYIIEENSNVQKADSL